MNSENIYIIKRCDNKYRIVVSLIIDLRMNELQSGISDRLIVYRKFYSKKPFEMESRIVKKIKQNIRDEWVIIDESYIEKFNYILDTICKKINNQILQCLICKYETKRLNNYNKHLETEKHKKLLIIHNNSNKTDNNIFKCERCNATFKRKDHLERHSNKKKPCSPQNNPHNPKNEPNDSIKILKIQNEEIDEDEVIDNEGELLVDNQCEYCKKIYSSKYCLTKHKKGNCGKKQEIDELEQMKTQIELLKQEKTNLEENYNKQSKEINKLKKRPNVNITNNNNNTVNNIQLNNYGREDIEYLKTPEFIEQLKRKPNNALLIFENMKHGHPQHSYNWNIIISNNKHNTLKAYESGSWVTKSTLEFLETEFLKGSIQLQEIIVDNAYYDGLHEMNEYNEPILDEEEQTIYDYYDKATCEDVKDEFNVKKLKKDIENHKNYIYDHYRNHKEQFKT